MVLDDSLLTSCCFQVTAWLPVSLISNICRRHYPDSHQGMARCGLAVKGLGNFPASCLHKPGPRWAWSWATGSPLSFIFQSSIFTAQPLLDSQSILCYNSSLKKSSRRVGLLIKVKEQRAAKSTPVSWSAQDYSMSMWTVDPPILNLYVIEVFEERISVWFYISWSQTNKHKCGNYYIELGIFFIYIKKLSEWIFLPYTPKWIFEFL